MPDDRLIHRAFGHSEKVNSLTDFEKLVWLMYKLASDDFGVMVFSASPVRAAATFLDKKPERIVLRALHTVRDVGLVSVFPHQGSDYLYQFDWQEWQKITHPRGTKQPAPPLHLLKRHTQWLFAHHPDGGKLQSWKAPKDFQCEAGSKPELILVSTGT
jgi:hypothetical protein